MHQESDSGRAVREAFLRYRDAHDVAALGFVFDHVVQRLLLVASHLVVPGVEAEDLVQATLLVAIQHAEAFDADRPLEPWLIGILTNEARAARRRVRRAPDPSRLPPAASADPVNAVASAEAVQHLLDQVATLPDRQRDAMVLHLVHGMTPTQIAHALGRPVGTVKSWLHRNLEWLRQRAPAGFALAGIVPVPDALLPMQLREHFLEHGRQALRLRLPPPAAIARAPSPGSFWRVGWFGMFAAAVLLLWWSVGGAAPATRETSAPAVAAATPPAADVRTPEGPHALAREEAPGGQQPTAELRLLVRWHDQGPAVVRGFVAPRWHSDARLRRREFVTDAEGRATIVGLLPGAFDLQFDRGAARELELASGSNRCECTLSAGLAVRGRVLGLDHQPVAGAAVMLLRADTRDDGFPVATSAADGTFAVRDVPAGVAIAAFADGFVPSRAVTLRAGSENAGDGVDLQLRFEQVAGTVAITVLDSQGQPLADALVQVGASDAIAAGNVPDDVCRPFPPWIARTAADGVAVCRQVVAGPRVPVFACAAATAGSRLWVRVKESEVARTLRLPASGSIAGTVHRGAAAAPGARVAVVSAAEPAPDWFVPTTTARPDGSWSLLGVATGVVVVEARDGEWFAQAECTIAAAATPPWHASLGRGGRIVAVARSSDGGVLNGYRVELHAHGTSHVSDVGPDGTCVLEPLGDLVYEAVLHRPAAFGGGMLLQRGGVRVGQVCEFVLPAERLPTASARGRLLHGNGAPMQALEILPVDRLVRTRFVPVAADGSFAVEGLEPGRHALLAGGYPYALLHCFDVPAGGQVDLGTLTAEAAGRVVVGLPPVGDPAKLQVALVARAVPAAMLGVARWLDGAQSVAMSVPPGDYLMTIGEPHLDLYQQQVVVRAGEATKLHMTAPSDARMHVVMEPPEPASWTWIRWRVSGASGEWTGACGPRQPGRASSSAFSVALPPGRYQVVATGDDGSSGACEAVCRTDSSDPVIVRLR